MANTVKLNQLLSSELDKNLLPATDAISKSNNDSAWVNNHIVYRPRRGDLVGAEFNRDVVPAKVAPRTDSYLEYNLNELTTNPTSIGNAEELLVNYNKRASVTEDHTDKMNQKIFQYCIEKWATLPSTPEFQLETTGAARPAYGVLSGNRKKMTIEDLSQAMKIFTRNNVKKDGNAWALLTADQMADLLEIPRIYDASQKGTGSSDGIDGFVVRYAGWNFVERSKVLHYDAANNLIAESLKQVISDPANDSEAALLWHPSLVSRAIGSTSMFYEDLTQSYGTKTISGLTRVGADVERADRVGVITIKDAVV